MGRSIQNDHLVTLLVGWFNGICSMGVVLGTKFIRRCDCD